jgi:hypothetical protein
MKPVPFRPLRSPLGRGAVIAVHLLAVLACGEEAPPPVIMGTGGGMANSTAGTDAGALGGTGVMPIGGTGVMPTGGTGADPSAGSATGGTGVDAGGTGVGGSAGTATSGTGGGGGQVDLKETVGGPLNGVMLTGPCLNDTAKSVCQTKTNGCPGDNNADFALSGVLTTDKTITLGGDPGKTYTITLHVQGEVEAKKYDNTQDANGQAQSPKADGFAVGGDPSKGDYYNVYLVRTSNPPQDYFLNSLIPPGVSNHTTYGIDYVAKIKANGGSSIRLVAADRNCSMIKNCGPQQNDGSQCTAPITVSGMDPVAVAKNPGFNFNQAYNGQWVVLVVTDVTEG